MLVRRARVPHDHELNAQQPPTATYVEVRPRAGKEYDTAYPSNTGAQLLSKLRDHGVAVEIEPKPSGWYGRLVFLLPLALLVVFWVLIVRRANATGGFWRTPRSSRRSAPASPRACRRGDRADRQECAGDRALRPGRASRRARPPRPRSGRARVDRPRRVHRPARRRDACTPRRAKDAYFHACTG